MSNGKRKTFEVEQQLSRLPWKFSKEEMLERIRSLCGVTRFSFIVHDKDITADGKPVEPHFDLIICFDNAHTYDSIAKTFQVPSQQVSKIKGTTADAEKYLTHLNAPDKFQYDPSEVIASYDYTAFYNKAKADREKKNTLDSILVKIDNQEIKPYNIHTAIGITDYAKYRDKIERAFYYVQLKMGINRAMKCVYIYGKSGVGKTTLAKLMAEGLGYKAFVSSGGKHPLDDYKGQECIILDDIRPDTFSFPDFLKLTDNNTDSLVGCRYYNKSISYCKMIICTSTLPISQLFSEYVGEEQAQIFRRFKYGVYEVTQNTVTPSVYDILSAEWRTYSSFPNPVPLIYNAEDLPFEDTMKSAIDTVLPKIKSDNKMPENLLKIKTA